MNIYGRVGWRAAANVNPPTPTLWVSAFGVWNADNNANDSVGTNHGTSPVGSAPSYVTGKIGQAFNFDGINDYVSLPTNSLNSLTGDFSVSCWVYLNTLTIRQGFIGNYIYVGGTADIKGFRVYYGASGTGNTGGVRIDIGDGSNPAVNLLSNNYLTLNTWYHVVVTRKSSTGTKIYSTS